ncbi:DinB family protein [Janthinobacterium sp.]|uniref:DinB family protein n=1 Tax=Janthinobacterium sp. TaxID=1871054 RepID=UPI002DB6291D|nr:DinB family protein [Janthinobacterium sp.]HEU4815899.1 DinB family protein [Janthinobacterium sp.]
MSEHANLVLLAQYNTWMNAKLYEAAAALSPQALNEDRGAFFGSLMGTLNHIVAGDTIWLKRFAMLSTSAALDRVRALPAPGALAAIYSAELTPLEAHRQMLDAVIEQWIAQLSAQDLEATLHYQNSKGVVNDKRLGSVLLHFFNHQTHHRGQASTLLSQAGVDIGVTDLLALIPNRP